MALDDGYLLYPDRAYGMDQTRYAWRTPAGVRRSHGPITARSPA